MPSAAAPSPRIRAFDWLRGLAVLFMIQCHAMVLLRPELDGSTLKARLIWLDGLVAPSFIFAAGFSLALVQVRGAHAGSRRQRILKTARRLGEVLFVASAVNWMWFPVFREPKWFLRVDILHCIGLALVIALPLMAALAKHPNVLRWVSLALGVGTLALSPLGERVHGAWALLANQSTDGLLPGSGATFPLLPWASYVYFGASVGATAAMGDVKKLVRWVVLLAGIGLALWIGSRAYLVSNHGNRIFVVALLVLFLLSVEYQLLREWRRRPLVLWLSAAGSAAAIGLLLWGEGPLGWRAWLAAVAFSALLLALTARVGEGWRTTAPVRFVEVFGASSLGGYFFHQMLLYYQGIGWWYRHVGFSFNAWWGHSCGWAKYGWLTAVLIAATYLLVRLMDRVYPYWDRAARRVMGT